MNFQKRTFGVYAIFADLIILWLFVSSILLLAGEATFILPVLFIGNAIFIFFIFSIHHISMRGSYSYLLSSLCLALFSYLSATDPPVTRPFFPILCMFVALYMPLSSWRQRNFFSTLHIFVWLSCISVTFYFGLWPVGLMAIAGSAWLSMSIKLMTPHLAHLLVPPAIPETGPQPVSPAPSMQKSDQQEVQIPQSMPDTLVPGQQYQPLLSAYDSSYGPYIHDLP
jgi:hypothetical protein